MPIHNIRRNLLVLAVSCGFLAFPGAASAQAIEAEAQPPVDILPAMSVADDVDVPQDLAETHPPVRLTPDKSEIIKLDREARTIVVGNPDHLNVLADTSKTLILVPRQPGATHFTVLDGHGEVVMQRHVIVASPKERYVRVRRSCAMSDNKDCQETSVFYCPDMCHKVNVAAEGDDSGGGSSSSKSGEKAESGNNSGGEAETEAETPQESDTQEEAAP
ncbi:MAG TPA: hypothetical protein DEA55_05180 [Rhodospirillaceae bacterium]|nr:hypothetical protein [Rhodospirillaceae bacterium]